MITFNQAALLEEVKPFALLASIDVYWEGSVLWMSKVVTKDGLSYRCTERLIEPSREAALSMIRILATQDDRYHPRIHRVDLPHRE